MELNLSSKKSKPTSEINKETVAAFFNQLFNDCPDTLH